jgi:hypothetical protein
VPGHQGQSGYQWHSPFTITYLSMFALNNWLYALRLGMGRGVSWPLGCSRCNSYDNMELLV